MKKTLSISWEILSFLMIISCSTPIDPILNDDAPILNTAKEITAFSFTASDNSALSGNITGTINGTDIHLTVPYATDVNALVATFTSTGESVTVGGIVQISGTTANNFTNDVTYRVMAADGSTQDYTVTVSIAVYTDFDWFVGDWSDCSEDCGGGIQTRFVECRDFYGFTYDDSFCEAPKPSDSQSCNTHVCMD